MEDITNRLLLLSNTVHHSGTELSDEIFILRRYLDVIIQNTRKKSEILLLRIHPGKS